MSFDQRPQKIRVVADGQKPRAAASADESGSAGSPSASARDAGVGKGGKPGKSGAAEASTRSQGALQVRSGAAGADVVALADVSQARGGWIIAALLFVLGSAVGGAAAMAAFFR